MRFVPKHIVIPKPGLCLTMRRCLQIMFSRCLGLALGTFPSLVDFELEAVPMPVLLEQNR